MPLPPKCATRSASSSNSVETLGMVGAVFFQAGTQGWVAVQPGQSGSVGLSA